MIALARIKFHAWLGFVACAGFCVLSAQSQQPKYVTENGVTYLEMPVRVQRPVREDKVESYQVTTYQPKVKTEVQQVPRYYYEPSYSAAWVPRVHGWARIFREPTVTWEVEPRYQWQLRSQNVPTTVAKTEWIPQTQVVQVPVTRLRLEEKVETQRVVVAGQPIQYFPSTGVTPPLVASNSGWTTAPTWYPPNSTTTFNPASPYLMPPYTTPPTFVPAQAYPNGFGGIAELDNDPPRLGMATEGNWIQR